MVYQMLAVEQSILLTYCGLPVNLDGGMLLHGGTTVRNLQTCLLMLLDT